jgi:CRISPR-associated endonuclease Csn1
MRRRRDRLLRRKRRFLDALTRHELMPADPGQRVALAHLDPFELRRKALNEAIPLHEFGRALFHLNQRRGFRSNRKVDKGNEESGKIRQAIEGLRAQMEAEGARTLGEWQAQRRALGQAVRARLRGAGAKARYDFYPDRELTAQEFDALWVSQSRFHGSALSTQARDELRDILLFQRPLRAVRPGRCTFESGEERAPLALASAQRFRIYQELNNVAVVYPDLASRKLSREERDSAAAVLMQGKDLSFARLRRLLALDGSTRINLESEKREKLKGDAVAAKLSAPGCFGNDWHSLTLADQDAVVEALLNTESETDLREALQNRWGLAEASASQAMSTLLPEGYGNLGRTAINRILPHLQSSVVPYSEACEAAGYRHSDDYDGVIHERLPYYGEALQRHVAFGTGIATDPPEIRFGRIANPTVHIGLNQVRKLTNAVIEKFGPPSEIVVEVARELKQSREQRERVEKEQAENQKRNDRIRVKLAELGQSDNGENRLRYRLWEELNPNDPLDRRCVYTGEQISHTRLFSDDVEIEHLIPFAVSLDDSQANKTLCLRHANRYKGDQTPHQAFHFSAHGYDWESILQRAGNLPENKRWRFGSDAMERFLRDEKDFLARQLTDTAYLSRLAKKYLTAICPPGRVWVTPGRLTGLLRGHWGLNRLLSDQNRKNRTDHRHHTLDALVIGVIDRGLLQKVASAAARATELGLTRLLEQAPEPWPGFRTEVAGKIGRVAVSYKPDHGHQGQLHNDTAYGLVDASEQGKQRTVVHRIALEQLQPGDLAADGKRRIRDDTLRARLAAAIADAGDFKAGLMRHADQTGLRRLRVLESVSVIPIQDRRDQRPYKAYKGDSNYCVEIWRDYAGRWREHMVTTFDAHQIFRCHPQRLRNPDRAQNGQSLVMRLCKNDLVAIEQGGQRRLMRVAKFSPGKIYLAEHFEANVDSRNRADDDTFAYLQKSAGSLQGLQCRRVFVDYLGRVLDPGFRP